MGTYRKKGILCWLPMESRPFSGFYTGYLALVSNNMKAGDSCNAAKIYRQCWRVRSGKRQQGFASPRREA